MMALVFVSTCANAQGVYLDLKAEQDEHSRQRREMMRKEIDAFRKLANEHFALVSIHKISSVGYTNAKDCRRALNEIFVLSNEVLEPK